MTDCWVDKDKVIAFSSSVQNLISPAGNDQCEHKKIDKCSHNGSIYNWCYSITKQHMLVASFKVTVVNKKYLSSIDDIIGCNF